MPSTTLDQLVSGLVQTSGSLVDFAYTCIKSAALQKVFFDTENERRKKEKVKRNSVIATEVQRREEAARALAAIKLKGSSSKTNVSDSRSNTNVPSNVTISSVQIEEELNNMDNTSNELSCKIKFDLSYDLNSNERAVNNECKRARRIIYELRATRYTCPEQEVLLTVDTKSKFSAFKNKLKRLYQMEEDPDYEMGEIRPILLQLKQLEGDFDLLFCELEHTDRVKNTFNVSPLTSDILLTLQNILTALKQIANSVTTSTQQTQMDAVEEDTELIKYEISVYTGTEGIVGTDIKDYPILLKLYSDSNESNYMNICESQANLPEASKINTYVFYCPDVGPLKAIGIFHRDRQFQSWDLRNIEVTEEKRGTSSFPVLATIKGDDQGDLEIYVAKNKGIMKEKPQLKVTKAAAKSKNQSTYGVEIKTLKGKLTYANKLTILFKGGVKIIGGLIEFSDGQTHFTPQSKDVFEAKWPITSNIEYMEISVRGPQESEWHCDSVTLTDFVNDKTYFFPLSGPIDMERIRVRAQNTRKAGSTSYQIKVKTGNKNTVGFEGPSRPKVFIQLASDVTVSDQFELKQQGSRKKQFERDSVDTFLFNNVRSVGQIQAAKLWHDGGESDAWFCENITVIDLDTSQTYTFPVNRWLGERKQDGLKSLDLQVDVNPDKSSSRQKYIPDEKNNKEIRENLGKITSGYVVIVKTGDSGFLGKSGTDAAVTMAVQGEKKQNIKLILKQSKNNKNPFEQGKTDIFHFSDKKSIGQLSAATLAIDPKSKIGWFCEYVTIEDVAQNKIYNFPVNRWLDKNQYDKQTSIELVTNKEPGYKEKNTSPSDSSAVSEDSTQKSDADKSAPSQASKGYIIKVKTGQKNIIKSAGTDNDVSVRFINENNKTTNELLLVNSTTNKNPFENGKTDEFLFPNIKPIGKIQKAVLQLKNDGKDAWFCEHLSVIDVKNKQVYYFPVNRWFDRNKYDKRLAVNLLVDEEPGYLPQGKDLSKYDAQSDENNTAYYFKIKTGSKGFESKNNKKPQVFINIMGTNSNVNAIHLGKSDKSEPFQKGQLDSFTVYGPNIGELKQLEIFHDGGAEDRWHAESLEFTTDENAKKWKKFKIKNSLDAKSPDGHCLQVLK
ncbi:hypothetical protein GJ496_005649 [Pomphorhynchus laevis]|nr:hypothetical protein GJ496_005649 [Pomphorhynchus laevis]